jgi:hypothetical protein
MEAMTQAGPRFCAWLHRHRWALLAAWIGHATILHLLIIGSPSWDALSYRLPPIVELIQHGDLGLDRYNDWALHGFVPFAELAQLPALWALGVVGMLLSYPLVVFPLCIVAVYKLGKQLTGSVHGGNFSALAYAAVPMVNQQPFTGYIDFIVSAALAYLISAILQLRESPRPMRSAIRVAAATVVFTMTRATGVYIAVLLTGLLYAALYVERAGGLRFRIVRRRALAITIAAFVVGALPIIAIQTYKYVTYGSPLYPYQFNLLGLKIGGGVPTKDLFFYAGLPDETWGSFARCWFGAWIWPPDRPLVFFGSSNLGGGWVMIAALLALPAFVRAAPRFDRWLGIVCVLVSLCARDFWLPRWAYSLVVVLAVVLGRALPAIAGSDRRRDRALFWALTVLLLVHFVRPEFDLWQMRRGRGIGPRFNAAGSPVFQHARGGIDPYPDLHARFFIIDYNRKGLKLPIFGPHLTNEVVDTIPADVLGDRCVGLIPFAIANPTVLFIDDQNHMIDCERACAFQRRDGSCAAYRYLGQHHPAVPEPWTAVAAGAPGAGWLTSGWSYPEPWGVWSTATDSVLTIPVPATGVALLLDLDWFSAVVGMNVAIAAGGETRTVTFEPAWPRQTTFLIKPVTGSTLTVQIHVDRLSHAADGRLLGIGLGRVRLRVR